MTLPPAQNVVAPPAETVGAGGIGFTVTLTGPDAALEHPLVVTTTV